MVNLFIVVNVLFNLYMVALYLKFLFDPKGFAKMAAKFMVKDSDSRKIQ